MLCFSLCLTCLIQEQILLVRDSRGLGAKFNHGSLHVPLGGGGGGVVLPYKSDGGASRIFWKYHLKGTRILFCGRGSKLILLLRGIKIKYILSYS